MDAQPLPPPADLNTTAPLQFFENRPIGSIVGELGVAENNGNPITYELISGEGDGNNSLFTIVTPSDINLSTFGNMHLWLDGNDSSTITHSSNYVSQWRDKSGRDITSLSPVPPTSQERVTPSLMVPMP